MGCSDTIRTDFGRLDIQIFKRTLTPLKTYILLSNLVLANPGRVKTCCECCLCNI